MRRSRFPFQAFFLLSLVPALAAGCGDSTTDVPDAGPDVVADAGGDVPPADLPDAGPGDVPVDADAAGDADIPPYADGATAFVSAAAGDLIGGPMAVGKVGDVVIRNQHARFVVRNGTKSLYSPYPGALVDADRARAAGEPGNDQFFELFPMVGFGRVFMPSKMEIADTGEFSGTAIVRFTGGDGGMSIIDSLLPTTSLGLEVTTDYVLGPDSRSLEIVTTIRNAGGVVEAIDVGQIVQLGKRLRKFHDRVGSDAESLAGASDVRWLAGADGDVSYALTVPPSNTLSLLLNVEELLILKAGSFTLAQDEEATVRSFLVVGAGTVDDALAGVRAVRGEPEGTPVEVQVALSDAQSKMADAWVEVKKAGGGDAVTAVAPGADGKATVRLAPGDYDFSVLLPGATTAAVTAVHVGDAPGTPVALAANPAGWLRVRARDPDGNPVTAALSLQSGHGAPALGGTVLFDVVHRGERLFPVLPGDYTANVARGLVWSLDRQDVTVGSGTVTDLDATIRQVVDTTGYRMLNSHEHTEWSPDSQVSVEDRVWNAVANGVDLMNATDHDHFGTRQPTIDAMGVGDQVASFVGCEVSPMWGHTTAGGCASPPAYDTYYAVDFVEYDDTGSMVRLMSASEIFRQAREEFQCRFLAVNHPFRSEGTFNLYKIDGTRDPALAEPDLDLSLVDGVEMYNKSDDMESILGSNLPAWFNLLNRGYKLAAVGGSDEHGLAGTYGSPRNMVPVLAGLDDPGLEAEAFDHMKAFRHLVLGGPVIRITVDGAGMGDTVTTATGTVQVHLQVLAPAWMGVRFAKVWANGVVMREFEIPASTDLIRLEETFDLPLLADSHVEAAAGSVAAGDEMGPVAKRAPFSLTNPVFVDVDGGGYKAIYQDGAPWDAP